MKNQLFRCRVLSTTGALAYLMIVGGCAPTSFLITPFQSNRGLVETVVDRDSGFAWPKIAVIEVSGLLMNMAKPGLLGSGEHPVSLFAEQLDRASRDSAVKAVLLKINSPGGTVVASELMYDELMHFKQETGKPVVAVMMDVAASGGYYLACACDQIVAQPSTVTGSIGVIMRTFDVSGTMNLLGIKSEAITSGPMKDLGSPYRGMKPAEREVFQHIIDDMYGRFVRAVAAGRPALDESAVRKLADGRVYTAGQALEAGLIDRIATMREVIADLKTQVGVKAARVVIYHRPRDYKPTYYARGPGSPMELNVLKIELPPLLSMTPQFLYLWAPGVGSKN